MPVEPDDPRITALLLGELTDAERAALEAKATESPTLAEALKGLRQTNESLRQELAAEPCPRLTHSQRELVMKEITAAGSTGGVTASGTWSALLTSLGWGSWGAWLAVAATSLLLGAGLLAWHWSGTSKEPRSDRVATRQSEPTTDDGQMARVRAVAREHVAVAEPPLIVLRVGQAIPLRVLGRVESGREVRVTPERLSWSTEPLTGFVEFDPETHMLRAVKPTEQTVLLTVRFDELTAKARIRVIANETRTPGD
jgi:hypothetical protein